MLLYRVQPSYSDGWILRHPDIILPMLRNQDKQALIAQLPEYFKRKKESARVQITNEFGQTLEEKVFENGR